MRRFTRKTALTVLIVSVLVCVDVLPAVAAPRPLPLPLRGVTLESVASLRPIVRSIAALSVRPAVRIVFQKGEPPRAYAPAVRRLRRHAYVMGEVLDSTAVRSTSVSAYRIRTRHFVRRFGSHVDIWEIGNELNGEWLGRPKTINAKALAAYRVVENRYATLKLRSAITLNYWPNHNCYAHPWEATLPFARRMPQELRQGVDFVFLSFYETACDPAARPSVKQFAETFRALERVFPRARVGFGEVGAQGRSDGFASDPTLADKQRIADRYYGMYAPLRHRLGSRFVGGYFWWYYSHDAVPMRRAGSLWPTLNRLLSMF